jgi:Asp-tRNA(Asn)/Glu-tRNA(Gln) amidotransferase B subunit
MAVRIKLNDGTEMIVEATIDELTTAMRAATESGDVVKIKQPDGRVIAITPQAVEMLQEEPEAQAGLAERFAEAAGSR